VTHNPYAPPGARVEEVAPRRRGGHFWARFYLSPTGRTGRLFYWLLGFIPLSLVGLSLGFLLPRTPDGMLYFVGVAGLFFWPQVVILARRLHDINLNGWWVMLSWAFPLVLFLGNTPLPSGAMTIVQWVAVGILGLIPGTRGPNKYGDDPRSNTSAARSETS
jgi:uncharacterized membrane protein YhaH (DUF805 family)